MVKKMEWYLLCFFIFLHFCTLTGRSFAEETGSLSESSFEIGEADFYPNGRPAPQPTAFSARVLELQVAPTLVPEISLTEPSETNSAQPIITPSPQPSPTKTALKKAKKKPSKKKSSRPAKKIKKKKAGLKKIATPEPEKKKKFIKKIIIRKILKKEDSK
jgi:hypothetical protein